MPRGASDYSNVLAINPLHRVEDGGEIAARLRSPVTYDRSGYVVFLSDFGMGLSQFGRTAAGTGASIALSTSEFMRGPFSMLMQTSATTDQISTAWVTIPITEVEGTLGLESGVLWRSDEIGFNLQIAYYTGEMVYYWTTQYRSDLDELRIGSIAADPVLDDDLDLWARTAGWHRAKMVVDLDSKQYLRVRVDEDEYLPTDHVAIEGASSEAKRIDCKLQGYTRDAATRGIYWDNMIVTQGDQ